MSPITALAIYFLIWWVTLFAVLPFGVRQQEDDDRLSGNDPGAPVMPHILAKLIWTTLVSAAIFGLFYLNYVNRLITLEDMIRWFGLS